MSAAVFVRRHGQPSKPGAQRDPDARSARGRDLTRIFRTRRVSATCPHVPNKVQLTRAPTRLTRFPRLPQATAVLRALCDRRAPRRRRPARQAGLQQLDRGAPLKPNPPPQARIRGRIPPAFAAAVSRVALRAHGPDGPPRRLPRQGSPRARGRLLRAPAPPAACRVRWSVFPCVSASSAFAAHFRASRTPPRAASRGLRSSCTADVHAQLHPDPGRGRRDRRPHARPLVVADDARDALEAVCPSSSLTAAAVLLLHPPRPLRPLVRPRQRRVVPRHPLSVEPARQGPRRRPVRRHSPVAARTLQFPGTREHGADTAASRRHRT